MVASNRIKDIDAQINFLQSRKKKLEDRRKDQLSTIMSRCHATTLPDEVLAGAILDAVRAYNSKDPCLSKWQQEGVKILKPGRGKRKATPPM